jgi:membrane protein DedA with SNARE-associated domain
MTELPAPLDAFREFDLAIPNCVVARRRARRYTARMLHDLIRIWFGWVHDWGYLGVIVLMAMESSIFPVPSEVVIPPAAIVASQEGGGMSLIGVIVAGTFGSWLGSTITYWVSLWVGRALILKWGKWIHITEDKVERAERFVHRYESGGIFFARLLPVIRHLISIPAGIIRMNFAKFSLMTLVGSAIWCSVLAWLGAKVGKNNPKLLDDPEALIQAVKSESMPIILAIAGVCVLYVLAMKLTAPKGEH